MNYIKVWCEYDFGGSFGGNNNEGVFIAPLEDIEVKVLEMLKKCTGLSEEDLDGLWDWEFIEVGELK